jgi:poly-beta-hydroxyalkanoate depolymerase
MEQGSRVKVRAVLLAHQEQISLMALTHTRPAFNYGVFNGKRWEAQIYPVVRNMIQSVT